MRPQARIIIVVLLALTLTVLFAVSALASSGLRIN
jgi:hypothetical protein